MQKPTPYSYVTRYYGVHPKVGGRIKHQVTQNEGVIVRPTGDPHYLRVRFDGEMHIKNVHPTECDYLKTVSI